MSHFTDKYDLLDKCVKANLEQLIDSCRPAGGAYDDPDPIALLRTIEYMEKNAVFYRTLLTNKSIPSFRIHLQDLMKKGMLEQVAYFRTSQEGTAREIELQFVSSAVAGVIEWWFTHPEPCSAKELTERLGALIEKHRLLLSGVNRNTFLP